MNSADAKVLTPDQVKIFDVWVEVCQFATTSTSHSAQSTVDHYCKKMKCFKALTSILCRRKKNYGKREREMQ